MSAININGRVRLIKASYRLWIILGRPNRQKQDAEKLVFPGVVFVNTRHKAFSEEDRKPGFLLFFGWWDWSACFGIIVPFNKAERRFMKLANANKGGQP
jgi:hypothetical protein